MSVLSKAASGIDCAATPLAAVIDAMTFPAVR